MTAVLWLLLLAPFGSWITSLILLRAAFRRPFIRLLNAVAIASLLGSVGGTLLAPLALARLVDLAVDPPVPSLLLVTAVVLFSLPGPIFLGLYLGGWFDADD